MHFVVTDLESTCDEPQLPRNEMEPIEIGAVIVNEKFEIIDKFETFIKPTIHSELTPFCTKLTTIKQSDVENAPTFIESYLSFEKWFTQFNDVVFCSWGKYDSYELRRVCALNDLEFYFSEEQCFNLKRMFAKKQKIGKEVGVRRALNLAGIKFEGQVHRGIDDAINISKLLRYSYFDDIIKK